MQVNCCTLMPLHILILWMTYITLSNSTEQCTFSEADSFSAQ